MKILMFTLILICISFCSALAVQLAGGEYHSLVLKENGAVWAWGENIEGQLGDGTTTNRWTTLPVQVIGLIDAISISAGEFHSMALKQDGTAWSWGYNAFGQLGNGTTSPPGTPNSTPGQMIGGSGVTAISAGLCHSLLLKSDGTVWTCGMNRNGQLGDGTITYRCTPVQVSGLSEVVSIAGGGEHSLALKRDGTVWAWGWNKWGQLGDGNGGGDILSDNYSTVPVQVIGLSNITAIAGGLVHSLAIKRDGTVLAWGANGQGQLGDGTISNRYTPVQVSGLSGVIAIEAGNYYSIALASYGTVWFCGYMLLDYNTFANIQSIIPVPVDGISGVKAIAGGGNHALFLKNDGIVWAMGGNCDGQIGDGTYTGRRYPVRVQGLSLAASSAPDSVLAADFDGDGRADPTAVQAPSTSSGQAVNAWYFWHSSQSYSRDGPYQLGMTGKTAAGDVDGDGHADMALVDALGNWYFYLSSRGYTLSDVQFLQSSAYSPQPVLADFDGDNKADPAIVDASGNWSVWLSAAGYSRASAPFALAGGTPLAADFDGDGKADPVMVSTSGGWYLWLSGSMYIRSGPYNFGLTGKPAAGDFDGDGKADPAVMDSSGNWYFWLSGSFYTCNGPFPLIMP